MPLDSRPIAISIAVLFFFGISIVGSLCEHTPLTCCKRAMIAATAAYFLATLAVRAVNAIIFNVIVTKQTQQAEAKQAEQARSQAEAAQRQARDMVLPSNSFNDSETTCRLRQAGEG